MFNKAALRFVSTSYADAIDNAYLKQNLSYKELLEIQELKLLKLIEHVKKNVPYYNNLLQGVSIKSLNDLSQIPFLTKDNINESNSKLKATNIPAKRFKKNSTSGSTGVPTYFFSDNKTDVVRHACAIRGDSWTEWKFGEPVVLIWGASKDTDKSHTFKGKLVNSKFLFNTKVLSSFDMTDKDMLNYISVINNRKPKLIVGYPSSLEVFSNFIISNNYNIYKPKGVITGGESLHEFQREIIQKAFKSKVLNRYGCRDVGHIANECLEQNGLHVSMDHVIVEIINDKGELCKPGELGEIVVTDLDNYVFPFIRYKIGDIGVFSNRKCSCGKEFSLLESVEGRTFDLIIGTNGNRVLATYWSIGLKYKVKGIDQFQIIQKTIGKITLKIVINKLFNEKEENKINQLFKDKLGSETEIVIEVMDKIEPTLAGKFRWVISEINSYS